MEIVKDNEIIAFIEVLTDLFLCKQYRDCVNEKKNKYIYSTLLELLRFT